MPSLDLTPGGVRGLALSAVLKTATKYNVRVGTFEYFAALGDQAKLKQLAELKESGVLTDDEFQAAKAKALAEPYAA